MVLLPFLEPFLASFCAPKKFATSKKRRAMANPLCKECKELFTHHKCIQCKAVSVCPLCALKRGYDDLNQILCKKCGPGPESTTTAPEPATGNDEEMPPPPATEEENDDVVATVLAGDDADNIGQAVGALLEAEPANQDEQDGAGNTENQEERDGRKLKKKPPQFNSRLGKNAEVSLPLKSLLPLAPIKEKYQNTYKQKRSRFIVEDVREFEIGKNKKRWVTFLLLKWKNQSEKPDGNEDTQWKCNFRNCKLERQGPPNQLFFPPPKRGRRLISPQPSSHPTQATNDEVADPESDVEAVMEPNPTNENVNDPYYVKWDDNFIDNIDIDQRGSMDKTSARLKGHREIGVHELTKLALFHILAPTEYCIDDLFPATNKELQSRGYDTLCDGEFDCWLGIWTLMQLHPGYQSKEFFNVKPRDMFWNPPYCGGVMSGKRFSDISACIRLRKDEDVPNYRDKFFWVRNLIDGFNENMSKVFCPAWIVCVDESMVVFYNKYALGWIVVKRKPHPMGNEYHTTACCQSKVIFWIELVQGKDAPKEGEHKEMEFEREFGSKVAALVVRMTKSVWGSGRTVMMDSGFGYIPSVVQLRAKGLFSTTVIKKHAHWPKFTKAAEAVDEMQGKEVGTIRVRKGEYTVNGECHKLHMVALADSLHTSLMVTNWSTTLREGEPKRRRVGGELVQFQYGQMHNHYYYGRHAVDDNNNNRQGCLSFEEVFVPKDWEMRQFGFVVALIQTNAFLLFNYARTQKGLDELSKAEFLRDLCKEMIENEDYEKARADKEDANEKLTGKRAKRAEEHELCKILAGRGKWNGKEFRKMKQTYQKYRCSGGCGSMIRTYCLCDKTLLLCYDCYSVHKAENN